MALLGEVPVVPDADTARRWLTEELLRPEYRRGESLLQRLLAWLQEQLAGLELPGLPGPTAALLVVGLTALLAAVAFAVAGPVRRSRRAERAGAVLGPGEQRRAAELRAAADTAAAAGDHATAVAERFRAVVRDLEERALLDPRPGRTAREAAADAGMRLPALATALLTGAHDFDDVVYGHVAVGADADARMRTLDAAVLVARPVAAVSGARPVPVGVPGAGAPAPDRASPGATP